jgi:hypothetical protein
MDLSSEGQSMSRVKHEFLNRLPVHIKKEWQHANKDGVLPCLVETLLEILHEKDC